MKGLIFTELLSMMETTFGEDFTEELIDGLDLQSGAAYTSVGNYDYNEALTIVTKLSEKSGMPVNALVKAFGKHLLKAFYKFHPEYFNKTSALDFLGSVDNFIHVEVKKLNPETELPKLNFKIIDDKVTKIEYSSTKPFADLAEGLIEETFEHYNESFTISSEGDDPFQRTFVLTRQVA